MAKEIAVQFVVFVFFLLSVLFVVSAEGSIKTGVDNPSELYTNKSRLQAENLVAVCVKGYWFVVSPAGDIEQVFGSKNYHALEPPKPIKCE